MSSIESDLGYEGSYPVLNNECNEQNLYCGACGWFRSMNSISFCCKLATVLLCLSQNIANDDLVCFFIMTLNMKKSQKMQISYQFHWCVQLQINAISKRIEVERLD